MKITLSRIFETSKAMATNAGQELSDFVDFVSQFSEQALRALRNGITFEDNMRCLTQKATLEDGKAQIVSTSGKVPTRVIVTRIYSMVALLDGFGWYIDTKGQMTVKACFKDAPANAKIDVDMLIFYD